MPRLSKTVPKYRKHRATGQAIVTLNGRDHYLGPYDSLASRVEYDRLIAEWLANDRRLPSIDPGGTHLSINELILTYWRHVQIYYVKNGRPTSEQSSIKHALRPLRLMYGRSLADDFGPLALKAVRQTMIETSRARTSINKDISRIKQMFRWAAENELISPIVYHGLKSIVGLKRGRTTAKETEPVRPVDESMVNAIRTHVPRQIWAMVQVQWLTGMRPGEVIIMRACDINMDGAVWLFQPESHKTQHHGYDRVVELGPRAQQVIRAFLGPDLSAYLFNPSDAATEMRAERRRKRKTPISCGNRPGSNRTSTPQRRPGNRYTVASYRRAITRGLERAFPHPNLSRIPKNRLTAAQREELAEWRRKHSWHPHQLRHSYATRIRRNHGLEAARILLGHRTMSVTEVYAELDRMKVAEIVASIG